MGKAGFKKRVRKLRAAGKTFSEIKQIFKTEIPKSTLSNWCKNIELPDWYKDKITELNNKNLIRAQRIAQFSNKRKRRDFLKSVESKAEKIISSLGVNNLKVILAALYLGEGAKWKGHSGLMLGSSDSSLILLYLELLDKCYNIKPGDVKCRISYRADQDIKKLEVFWSKITAIPPENFYKTKPDPRTFGKKTKNKEYKGVCVITCRGTDIQLELEKIVILLLKKLRAHSLEAKR